MALGQEIAQAFVKIRPDSSSFARDVEREVGAPLRSIQKTAAGLIGGTAFIGFLKVGIDKLKEMERVNAQTAVALRQTGGAAGVTAEQIHSYAQAVQDTVGVSRESVQASENVLLAFTSVKNAAGAGNDIFNQATTAALDLSVAYGQDLTTSARTVGRALDAPANATRALRAANIILTQSEKDKVKALEDSGDHLGAQKVLLEQITERVGGAAAAYGQTLGGQLDKAKNALLDTGAAVAQSVEPAIEHLAASGKSLAQGFEALPGPIQTTVVAMIGLSLAMRPISFGIDAVKASAIALRASFVAAGGGMEGFIASGAKLAKGGVIAAGIYQIMSALKDFQDQGAKTGKAFTDSLPDPSNIDAYIAAVNKGVEKQHELVDQLQAMASADAFHFSVPELGEQLNKRLTTLGHAADFLGTAVTGSAQGVVALKGQLDGLNGELEPAVAHATDMSNRVAQMHDRFGVTGTAVKDFVKQFKGLDISQVSLDRLHSAMEEAKQPGADLAAIATELGVKVRTAGDDADGAAAQYKTLHDAFFGLVDAQKAAADAQTKITDAQRTAGEAVDRVVDAQRAAVTAEERVTDARKAARAATEAVADAEHAYAESTQRVQDAQTAEVTQAGRVADAIDQVRQAQEALTAAQSGPNADDELRRRAADIRVREAELALKQLDDSKNGSKNQSAEERQLARDRAQLSLDEAKAEQAKLAEDLSARVADATKKLSDAQDNLTQQQEQAVTAARAVTDAQYAQQKAAEGVTTAQDAATKATGAITDAQYEAGKAARAVGKAQDEVAKATDGIRDAQYNALKATDALAQKQLEWSGAIGENNAQLQTLLGYLIALGGIAPGLTSTIDPLAASLAALGAGAFGGGKGDDLTGTYVDEHGRLQHRSMGGPLRRGQASTVSELGTEVWKGRSGETVIVPGEDGVITPAGQTGSGGVVIHQTNNFEGPVESTVIDSANRRLLLGLGEWT